MSEFNLYSDSGLTTLASVSLLQEADVAPVAKDGILYLGAVNAGWVLQNANDPGIDQIVINTVDSDPVTGPAASFVKLALSAAGLDTAVGGDPLNIGVQVLSEVANAVPIHYRFDPQTLSVGRYTDLSFSIPDVIEYQP